MVYDGTLPRTPAACLAWAGLQLPGKRGETSRGEARPLAWRRLGPAPRPGRGAKAQGYRELSREIYNDGCRTAGAIPSTPTDPSSIPRRRGHRPPPRGRHRPGRGAHTTLGPIKAILHPSAQGGARAVLWAWG